MKTILLIPSFVNRYLLGKSNINCSLDKLNDISMDLACEQMPELIDQISFHSDADGDAPLYSLKISQDPAD